MLVCIFQHHGFAYGISTFTSQMWGCFQTSIWTDQAFQDTPGRPSRPSESMRSGIRGSKWIDPIVNYMTYMVIDDYDMRLFCGYGFLIDGIDSYDLYIIYKIYIYIYMTMIHVNCFLYVFVTIGRGLWVRTEMGINGVCPKPAIGRCKWRETMHISHNPISF